MRRPLPTVLSAVAALGPTATAKAAVIEGQPQAGAAAAAKTYHGARSTMRWGVVQVTITVVGRRVTRVSDSLPEVKPRSLFINQRAEPILKRETLQAQSARIKLVSGATLTSRAWAQSLQYALTKAHI